MAQHISNNRINQLPIALSGIIHEAAINGIRLSIFNPSVASKICEMPLLP
ncbi:hypothetical protein P9847_07560 [Paenibacillus chibensis]|uniref:Uncharacterized protein n=1 Tax=Paenibacillus chibensis TaxID=59846 RepID=A0ABU6PQL2_9BACL|nr:hypothetical protein [Paenibacillus chibensis]MEC0369760.1 hypothetical protein [Paenibacillus chibensis]MED5017166.1 hypothetical protein [Paenibacillus chibensis]